MFDILLRFKQITQKNKYRKRLLRTKMRYELVFVSFPEIGHVQPTVETAKLLVERDDRISISVLILPFLPGEEDGGASAYVASLFAACNNRLRYEVISRGDEQNAESTRLDIHIKNQIPKARRVVGKLVSDYSTLPDSPRLAGLVVDMFCTLMTDVANEFGIPSYLLFSSSAGLIGLGFHVQKLCDENKYHVHESDYEDSEAVLDVPSFTRPFPVKCLPPGLASKEWLPILVNQSKGFRQMKGILSNTVAELEPYMLESLSGGDTPPVYPIGPLLHLENQTGGDSDILEWLDEQPLRSVVFLCFGSRGGLSEEQARELAVALERSGYRFLWSLRRASKSESPKEFTNFDKILPQGFIDRTKKKGKVIGWAPQTAVLAKPAIGGFVTHCGWNSVLESLWFGVPMAAWPMYAEQKFNAFEVVEELGLAVEIKKYWRSVEVELVTTEELEKAINCLMEQDSEVRKRVKEMSENCHMALMDGGSSQIALQKFIQDVIKNINA